MNLLQELAFTVSRSHSKTPLGVLRSAYADACAGLRLILSEDRFAGLRPRIPVRSEEHRQQLLAELNRLEAAGFIVESRPGEEVTTVLERSGYRGLAETLPMLHELAKARLSTVGEVDPALREVLAALDESAEEDLDDEDEVESYGRDESRRDEPVAPGRAPVPVLVPSAPAAWQRATAGESQKKAKVTTHRRRASVRWYRRMNPERMFPLTVTLAQGRLRLPTKPGVGQAVGKEQISVTSDNPFIRIRPVLPGCTVYPDEQTVDATVTQVDVRFQVAPLVLGTIEDARIEFYQGYRLVSRVDLPIVVSKQTVALVFAALGIGWPILGTLVKTSGTEPQDILTRGLTWALAQPHALEIGLGAGALAAALWWWFNRPQESTQGVGLNELAPMTVPELIAAAQLALAKGDRAEARSCAEDALNLDPLNSIAADLVRRCQG